VAGFNLGMPAFQFNDKNQASNLVLLLGICVPISILFKKRHASPIFIFQNANFAINQVKLNVHFVTVRLADDR
jgi:uncharacterized metal-binding protein